jgi:hypothetical protein
MPNNAGYELNRQQQEIDDATYPRDLEDFSFATLMRCHNFTSADNCPYAKIVKYFKLGKWGRVC